MQTFSLELVPEYFVFAKEGDVFVFDTETTGLNDSDDIVQLAMLHVKDGQVKSASSAYIRSTVKIDGTEAASVNGLSDDFLDLNGKPPITVLGAFRMTLCETIERYGRCLLVAHNLPFDLRMVNNALKRYGMDSLPDGIIGCDTKEFVKALNLPKSILPNNRLCSCVDSFALDAQNTHDAMDDVMACYRLFQFLTAET